MRVTINNADFAQFGNLLNKIGAEYHLFCGKKDSVIEIDDKWIEDFSKKQ